jgi:hypothetical protein
MKCVVGAALVAFAMSLFITIPLHASDAGGTICGDACLPKRGQSTLQYPPPKPPKPYKSVGKPCPPGYFRGRDRHTCYQRLH